MTFPLHLILRRRYLPAAFLLSVLLSVGCALPRNVNPEPKIAALEQKEDGRYFYEDRLVSVLLEVDYQGRGLLWRFKNQRRQIMQLDHKNLYLEVAGQSRPFTLWGSARTDNGMPPIELAGKGFVGLKYPILYNSPVWPFDKAVEAGLTLHFQADWGEKKRWYHLQLQAVPEP